MRLNSDKLRPTLVLLGICAWLTACDGLERVVDETARVPTTDLPTITSFICPQDTVLAVRVETTLPAVGTSNTFAGQSIAGAVVTLSDGSQTVTLRQDKADFGTYKTRAGELPVAGGKLYTLRVALPDGRVAGASCLVPIRPVDPATVSIEKVAPAPNTNTPAAVVRWRDVVGETNYYALYYYYYTVDAGGQPPRSGYYDLVGFFADTNRDGQFLSARPVDYQLDRVYETGFSRSVFFLCLTDKLYYDYHRALDAVQLSKDNPFADPARIPTNVQGGYGIFSGYNRLDLSIE